MKTLRLLIALLTVIALAASGCDDDGGSSNSNTNNNPNNNNNVNNPTDNTVNQVQNPDESGFLSVGDDVTLKSVVVTAIDNHGSNAGQNIWVSEPTGGPWSGVQVYRPSFLEGSIDSLTVGTAVDVTGKKDEFNYQDEFEDPITEIVDASVKVLGPTQPVEPAEMDASDLNSVATGEKWEGVLVKVKNVRIRETREVLDASGMPKRYEVYIYPGTKLQDELMDLKNVPGIAKDVCLAEVTGIVTYFYGYYIIPRSEDDIVISADDSACPQLSPEVCDDGIDNDGDGFADCQDKDCWGKPPCIETNCSDGIDNDGDGKVDCDDVDCRGKDNCEAPRENDDTLCADGIDNDGDGFVDCDDPSCYGHPDVTVCKETACTDGTDNDGDGYTDCDDWDCMEDPACDSYYETGDECTDGTDNDGDGYTDCRDRDCRGNPACVETECADGTDNDGDGYTDCDDWDCMEDPACDDRYETGDECADGIDNDGDNKVDCQDSDCRRTYAGCTETACDDGQDNDGDGYVDCNDWDCSDAPNCEGSPVTCADGIDNDGDGFVDCEDFSCRYCPTDPGKTPHVVSTCPPCDTNDGN